MNATIDPQDRAVLSTIPQPTPVLDEPMSSRTQETNKSRPIGGSVTTEWLRICFDTREVVRADFDEERSVASLASRYRKFKDRARERGPIVHVDLPSDR